LRQHRGVQVFDRRLTLRDDATDPAGLPFPCDIEGTAKPPVDLIVEGKPATPALDQRQAAIVGLSATGNAVSGDDSWAEHLHMLPGEDADEDLLAAAEGGLAAGWIERVECFDPRHADVRVVLRGVRRVRDGRLAEPLPDLMWEDSLIRVLGTLLGVGRETVAVTRGTFGGIVAPPVVVAQPRVLRVA
jgi:predicted Zn-dependent protease